MPRIGFKHERCVYCDCRLSTTVGDHVFASGLMEDKRWPPDHPPIRVPACVQCQRSFHDPEQHVIKLLAININSGHPMAQRVARGQVLRSFDKAPGTWREIRGNARPVNIVTPEGVFVGPSAHISPHEDWFEITLIKIARGLFFHHFGYRLPVTHDVGVIFPESREAGERMWNDMRIATHFGPYDVGNGVAEYAFQVSESEPSRTNWLVNIYRGNLFYVATAPAKVPGDLVMYPVEGHPVRHILLERTKDEATLCCAAVVDGEVCRSPIIEKLRRSSLLAAFEAVGHVDVGGL